MGTSGSKNISGIPTSSHQLSHEHGPVASLSPERSPSCGRLSSLLALLLKEVSLLSATLPFSLFSIIVLLLYFVNVPLPSLC